METDILKYWKDNYPLRKETVERMFRNCKNKWVLGLLEFVDYKKIVIIIQ